MKRHVNIPVFIPHLGCPNQCVFCNQRVISGKNDFNPEGLRDIIETALSTVGQDDEVEIAFFGGSFTGIDFDLMSKLLEIAGGYVESGRVRSIRCSTRPDYINPKILDTLKKYGVKVIELGLQSSSDSVLSKSKRGHNRAEEEYACKLIKEYGFSLVGQMMIGLPGASLSDEIETAKFIIDMKADAARIYPTVVFIGTELEAMTKNGEYSPLSNEEAAMRSAEVLALFDTAGVKVIRIGLCASENLSSDSTYVGGPNHSAMGELVLGELYLKKILKLLNETEDYTDSVLNINVSVGAVSAAVGQNRKNKNELIRRFGFRHVNVREDRSITGYGLTAYVERTKNVLKNT